MPLNTEQHDKQWRLASFRPHCRALFFSTQLSGSVRHRAVCVAIACLLQAGAQARVRPVPRRGMCSTRVPHTLHKADFVPDAQLTGQAAHRATAACRRRARRRGARSGRAARYGSLDYELDYTWTRHSPTIDEGGGFRMCGATTTSWLD